MLGLTEKIVDFSFSGQNAGKLVLADKFKHSEVTYEYSLDGKRTWKMARGMTHALTKAELDSINEQNDVAVYFVGSTGHVKAIVVSVMTAKNAAQCM